MCLMKVRFTTDKKGSWKRIASWQYPWPQDVYDDHVMVEVTDKGKVVAHVWFEWLNDTSLAIHMVADPDYRGKWMSARVLRGLRWAIELLGGDEVVTIAKDEDVVKLSEKLGFEFDEETYEKHGLVIRRMKV